MKTSSSAEYYL